MKWKPQIEKKVLAKHIYHLKQLLARIPKNTYPWKTTIQYKYLIKYFTKEDIQKVNNSMESLNIISHWGNVKPQ